MSKDTKKSVGKSRAVSKAVGKSEIHPDMAKLWAECPCVLFKAFFEDSTDPVLIFKADGTMISINKTAEELFGVKLHDLKTYNSFMSYCYSDEKERDEAIKQSEADLKKKNPPVRLKEIRCADGSARWFKRIIKRLSDDIYLMVGQDVTDLKQSESLLARADYALENASEAILWIASDARLLYGNKKACGSLRYTKKELLGLSVYDIDPLFSRKVWAAAWDRIKVKKTAVRETIHERKDGVTFPVEVSANYEVFDGHEYIVAFIRDISQRKEADKALLESETSFRILSEVAFEAISIHDHGVLINANKRFYEMYGYTEDELKGKDIVKTTVAPCELKKVAKRVAAGPFAVSQSIHIRKDGTEFPVEVRIREMEYNGKTVRVEAIVDITDRKRSEESLRESELRYQHIVESSPIGMYMYQLMDDDRLVLVGANPAADRLTGSENSSKIGLSIEDAFPGLRETELPERYKDAARAGKYWYAEQITYKDDKIAGAFEVHAFQTVQNQMVAAFWNITDRKDAEAECSRLAAAVESAAESIIITDARGIIIYVNPWFENMTGFSKEDILGQHSRVLGSGKHDKKFYSELWDTVLKGEAWRGRFINKKKDGTLFEEDAVISPVKNESGEIVNFVAVKRDVTQEVMLENQVLQSQKMAAIGQLAHKVAHNFTNILVLILGNAQLAKEYLPAGTTESEQCLDEVIKAANRVSTLTAELLAFAHPAEPRLRVQRLDKALIGLEDLLKETIAPRVELVIDLSKGSIRVNIDAVQIEQALLHLAINADDAMRADGGVLTIKAGPSEFGQGFAVITVTDTGVGFQSELKKKIFDPFFSTKQSAKNPGLGLATVYSIVNQHGGYISVDSKPGSGATFKIYLPLAVQ